MPAPVRLLVVGSLAVALGYGIITPALPLFARSFDVGVTAASTVISAFAACRLAFGPVSGRLVGRVGELRMFCAGLVVVAVSSAACAFATNFGQLLVFRAVGGIGSTMFTVAAALLLIRIVPPSLRGRAAGAWATGSLLGALAGPLVGAALITVHLRAPFLLYAALLVLTAVVCGRTLTQPTGPAADRPPEARTFATALRNPTFRAALSSNFVYGWTVYGIRIALVPLYVVDVLARPPGWSGLALAVTAAGTAPTLLAAGRLADTRGRKVPALIGLAGTAAGTAWLGYSHTLPEFLVASFLAGIGTGMAYPPTNAAVADVIADEDRPIGGSALAGFQMVGDVGAVVGPVLAGLLVDGAGYGPAFALSAAVAIGSWGCWLRAAETVPRTVSP